MIADCINKLQTRPNLVLTFDDNRHGQGQNEPRSAIYRNTFPSNHTISLGATSPRYIQVNQPPSAMPSSSAQPRPTLEHKSSASMMAINFPGATILPFYILDRPEQPDLDFLKDRLCYHSKVSTVSSGDGDGSDPSYWKAMILYTVGKAVEASDKITTQIQKVMPDAVIVGGVCNGGYVSAHKYTKVELESMPIKHIRYILTKHYSRTGASEEITKQFLQRAIEKSDLIEHVLDVIKEEETAEGGRDSSLNNISISIKRSGAFGVILGGPVPVKSVVSRGVHSILNSNGPPRSFSNLVVHVSRLLTRMQ